MWRRQFLFSCILLNAVCNWSTFQPRHRKICFTLLHCWAALAAGSYLGHAFIHHTNYPHLFGWELEDTWSCHIAEQTTKTTRSLCHLSLLSKRKNGCGHPEPLIFRFCLVARVWFEVSYDAVRFFFKMSYFVIKELVIVLATHVTYFA